MNLIPRIADISHHTDVHDFHATANAGVWGIICKCTQGTSYIDKKYPLFRKQVLDAGMLWGAYHFNSGSNPETQVDFFIKHAQPDATTLMALDFEHNDASSSASNMTPDQMVRFLHYAENKLGRKLIIYSGNYLKEGIKRLNATDRTYVCQHKLWLAQYGSHANPPIGFMKYFMWQYTGDGLGPHPHFVPGIHEGSGLDLNVYDGTREELTAEWAT